jgi:hypothetical protein
MPYRPNYSQQRGDRDRAKQARKQERLARREQEALKRKAERDVEAPAPDGEQDHLEPKA